MKKFLTVFAFLAVLCSCEKHEAVIVPAPSGSSVQFNSVLINVNQDMWQYTNTQTGDNNCFFATVDMPEIDADVYDKGLVKAYRVFDYRMSSEYQMELPYIRFNELVSYSGGQKNKYLFTESVDYEFRIGQITIYYTASDFDYEDDLQFIPEPMRFRAVVVY